MNSWPNQMPWWAWILLFVILFSQSFWIFRDAGKRGANSWLWGFWGLLQFPTPLVVYLIVVRKIFKKKKNKA